MFWIEVIEIAKGGWRLVQTLKVGSLPECYVVANQITEMGQHFAFCINSAMQI